jgi:uncharacterized protein (TIGR01244 family)
MNHRLTLAAALWACLAAGCASSLQDAPIGHAQPVPEWSGQFNNAFRDGDVIFTGRPANEGFYAAAGAGVTVVVDLLPPAEQQDTEQATVERLGMRYVSIPITPATFSESDVERFAEVLGSTRGPVLVHCSSSNRSGGLWAAYLVRDRGFAIDDAIERGREAGLSRDSMVEAVRRVAETQATPATDDPAEAGEDATEVSP